MEINYDMESIDLKEKYKKWQKKQQIINFVVLKIYGLPWDIFLSSFTFQQKVVDHSFENCCGKHFVKPYRKEKIKETL